jgi:benzoate 4-monooxygenase
MSSNLLSVIKHLVPLQLADLKYLSALLLIPAPILLAHVISYLRDPYNQRSIRGPFLARFSDIWLGWVTSQGHRSDVVHQLHNKYGMRI